jgi:putative redox protein
MELVLMGLGGCAAYDVISILVKSREQVTDCVTELTATRVEEIPQVFDTIHLQFQVTGHDLDEKKVARAVSLSADKYCSASRMLERGGVQITHSYEIVRA